MKKFTKDVIAFFGSLKMSLVAQGLLLILVLLCTFAQVNIGTFNAIDQYFRHFFLWSDIPKLNWRVPVFPAGGAIGLMLLLSLCAEFYLRFSLRRRKIGIWLIHFGLVVLVLGEFVTGMFAVESQMAILEKETLNYSESPRHDELVVIDSTHPEFEKVYSIDESKLRKNKIINNDEMPFSIRVVEYYENAGFEMANTAESQTPGVHPLADKGVGLQVRVEPLAPVSRDEARNARTAYVQIIDGNETLGTWLVSSALAAPQGFIHKNRVYHLAMRAKRHYLPYQVTLLDFKHDLYPGTNIPKNFSSLIQLKDELKEEDREILIWMNNPLRYRGNTFYQASFGENDTLSVLQVVANPGWLLPYISFVLMGFGLLIHFILRLTEFNSRRPKTADLKPGRENSPRNRKPRSRKKGGG